MPDNINKIDLRKIFDKCNQILDKKLTCEKLYIVPAMRYWIDEYTSEVVIATLQLSNEPYKIKSIRFNPDITHKKMIEILKDFVSKSMVLGNHWSEYVEYKQKLK